MPVLSSHTLKRHDGIQIVSLDKLTDIATFVHISCCHGEFTHCPSNNILRSVSQQFNRTFLTHAPNLLSFRAKNWIRKPQSAPILDMSCDMNLSLININLLD